MPKPPSDLSPLEDAAAQLRAVGVGLTVAPGEYIVNFHRGKADTEYRTGDLADALSHGLSMGPPPTALPPLGPMGKGNGSRRAKMYAHNRKLAAKRRKDDSRT